MEAPAVVPVGCLETGFASLVIQTCHCTHGISARQPTLPKRGKLVLGKVIFLSAWLLAPWHRVVLTEPVLTY